MSLDIQTGLRYKEKVYRGAKRITLAWEENGQEKVLEFLDESEARKAFEEIKGRMVKYATTPFDLWAHQDEFKEMSLSQGLKALIQLMDLRVKEKGVGDRRVILLSWREEGADYQKECLNIEEVQDCLHGFEVKYDSLVEKLSRLDDLKLKVADEMVRGSRVFVVYWYEGGMAQRHECDDTLELEATLESIQERVGDDKGVIPDDVACRISPKVGTGGYSLGVNGTSADLRSKDEVMVTMEGLNRFVGHLKAQDKPAEEVRLCQQCIQRFLLAKPEIRLGRLMIEFGDWVAKLNLTDSGRNRFKMFMSNFNQFLKS